MKRSDKIEYNEFLKAVIKSGYEFHDDSLPEPLKDNTYYTTKDGVTVHKEVNGRMITFGVDVTYLWRKELIYFICENDEEFHYINKRSFLADLKELGVIIDF